MSKYIFLTCLSLIVPSFSDHVYRLAHLTDIHYDPYYRVGAPTHCLIGDYFGSRCCRDFSIPFDSTDRAGYWGNANCDTNLALINQTLASLAKLIRDKRIDAVLYTGDSNSHLDYLQFPWTIEERVSLITSLFKQHFNVPVYNVLGNHESWPIDNLDSDSWSYLANHVKQLWSPWLSSTSLQTLSKGGYYVEQLYDNLYLVVLQTIWYDSHNYLERVAHQNKGESSWSLANQMHWLNQTLAILEDNGGKVIISGHVPPCAGEAGDFTNLFRNIVERYSNILVSGIFGHEHYDSFRILNTKSDHNLVTFLSPSVVPDVNPRYRIFTFNITSDYAISHDVSLFDIETYWANLTYYNTKSMEMVNSNLEYHQLYSFRKLYNMDNLSIPSFQNLVSRLKNNDTLFDHYYWLRTTSDQLKSCRGYCQSSTIENLVC